jgi:branched-chain amino acid transport system ATP-binding protein
VSTVLETRGLNKRFGAVIAAADIAIAIGPQEVVGIIGANGAGKTTFINMVTGYLKPDSGAILYRDREITALGPRAVTRLGIHRSFQIPQIFPELSVFDNLLVALGIAAETGITFWRPLRTPALTERAEEILERYRIDEYRDQAVGVLPQGARKLLDIAMAMVGAPTVLLLDEPTSGISADEKMAMMDTIMAVLAAAEVTVLFVEHDMEVVARYARRVAAFADGAIIADGDPDTVLGDSEVRTTVVGPELHRRG